MLYESCLDSLTGSPGKSHSAGDRFIPNRSAMDLDVSHYALTNNNTHDAENTDGQINTPNDMYKKELAQTLMCSDPSSAKVLALKSKAPKPSEENENSLRVLYTQNREAGFCAQDYTRHIPQAPERILDAPELLDDYYLNLLDWSSTNVLGVALGDSIYLWNASDGSIQQLMQTPGRGSARDLALVDRAGQLHGRGHVGPQGADLGRGEAQAGALDGRALGARLVARVERPDALLRRRATPRSSTTTCASSGTRWAAQGAHPGGLRPQVVALGQPARPAAATTTCSTSGTTATLSATTTDVGAARAAPPLTAHQAASRRSRGARGSATCSRAAAAPPTA